MHVEHVPEEEHTKSEIQTSARERERKRESETASHNISKSREIGAMMKIQGETRKDENNASNNSRERYFFLGALDELIRDQGEIAIAIELKEERQNPIIIGHSNSEMQIKTSLDYRNAFLAAANMHEAPIIYYQG